MKKTRSLIGVVMLLIAGAAWGAVYPIAKLALSSMDSVYLTLIRYGGGVVILSILLFLIEGASVFNFDKKIKILFFYGTAGTVGVGILLFVGIALSTPVNASIIIALVPLLTTMGNWISKKGSRPNLTTSLCIFFAFMGVFLVITDGNVAVFAYNKNALGNLVLLLSAISWVIYTLGAAAFPTWSPLRYTTLSTLLGIIPVAMITIIASVLGFIHFPSLTVLSSVKYELFYMIIVGIVIAFFCWNSGIKRLGSMNGSLFINLIPITTFIIEIALGHHYFLIQYIGAALTLIALIVNYFAKIACSEHVKLAVSS